MTAPTIKLDASLGTDAGPKGAAGAARAAEAIGISGLWSSETKHDAFLPLTLAADATQSIVLGTSIAVAFSRSPMELAQSSWDLQALSDGRFVLGLGTQVRAHIERRFSMPFDKPTARLAEYVRALRAIWRSFETGEPLRFEGEFYQHTLLTPFFNPGPIAHPQIPVHVAGVGARLARLAGELCDGFHVHPFHTPKYVREVLRPAIAEGAEGAGRETGAVELVTSVFVVTGASGREFEGHREAMRAQIAFYASTPTYRPVLETHGWAEVGEKLSVLAREGKWRELPTHITDEMLRTFAVEAAPDELGAVLRERYAGLVDRLFPYVPFVPGERDGLWRRLAGSFA